MNKTSYEKEGLNSLNELFEKLIKCSEENDTKGTMRIVSSLTEEEKDYMYSWAKEQNNLAKVAGIVVEAEMAKKAFDIDCRFKKQVLEALPIQGYCLENDPTNPDCLGNDTIKFTDNKYINGKIDLRNRKVYLEARDAENRKYEKTIDYSSVGDLMESINHFRKDIEETFEKPEVVEEVVKEEPFDILGDKNFLKEIGADWVTDLIKKKAEEGDKKFHIHLPGNFYTQEIYGKTIEDALNNYGYKMEDIIEWYDDDGNGEYVKKEASAKPEVTKTAEDTNTESNIQEAINNQDSQKILHLLEDNVISPTDPLYSKAIDILVMDPECAYDAINLGVIQYTRASEEYEKAVNSILNSGDVESAIWLIARNNYTGKLFDKVLELALQDKPRLESELNTYSSPKFTEFVMSHTKNASLTENIGKKADNFGGSDEDIFGNTYYSDDYLNSDEFKKDVGQKAREDFGLIDDNTEDEESKNTEEQEEIDPPWGNVLFEDEKVSVRYDYNCTNSFDYGGSYRDKNGVPYHGFDTVHVAISPKGKDPLLAFMSGDVSDARKGIPLKVDKDEYFEMAKKRFNFSDADIEKYIAKVNNELKSIL